jgi:hypothetical protein
MWGEELNASNVTERGLLGDRGYGLADRADGHNRLGSIGGAGAIASDRCACTVAHGSSHPFEPWQADVPKSAEPTGSRYEGALL